MVHILLDEIASLKAAQSEQTISQTKFTELEAQTQDVRRQLNEANASSKEAASRMVRSCRLARSLLPFPLHVDTKVLELNIGGKDC